MMDNKEIMSDIKNRVKTTKNIDFLLGEKDAYDILTVKVSRINNNSSVINALVEYNYLEEFKSVLPIVFNHQYGIFVADMIADVLKDRKNTNINFINLIRDYIVENNVPISVWGGKKSKTDGGLYETEINILEKNNRMGFDILLNSQKEIPFSDIPYYFNVMMSVTDGPMKIIDVKEMLMTEGLDFKDLKNNLMRVLYVLESMEIRYMGSMGVHEIDRTSYDLWSSKVESLMLGNDLSENIYNGKTKKKL